MDSLFKDLRYAGRMLLKSPVLTGAALLSLALGIGANTTIFTLVNAVLLRGLPVADPETLVAVSTTEARQNQGNFLPVSRPNYRDLREKTDVFEELVAIFFVGADLTSGEGEPEPVGGLLVTGNYFAAVGVEAHVGRVFADEGLDESPGAQPVVVLSHPFWSNRFGADPGVIGQTVMLNRAPFTVIGVTPPGFRGTFALGGPDLWTPLSMREPLISGFLRTYFDDRRALTSAVFGRLKPGVTLEQGNAALTAVGAHLSSEYPDDNKERSFAMAPLEQAALGGPDQRDNAFQAGGLLMAVVGLVLLIACANVANLLLGRAASRRREIGVRLALGATRSRLVRQLFCESLLMALAAGVLGLGIAFWARQALWAQRPPGFAPDDFDISFDPQVLVFTLVVSAATGILFGLAPAIRSSRPDLIGELMQPADGVGGAGRVLSFRNVLVMGQVMLSLVALVGSGLFLRSLGEAMRVDVGYEPERLLIADLNVARAGYDDAGGEAFYDRVAERVAGVPGAESAVLTTIPPLSGGGFLRTVFVEGRDENDANNRILVPVNATDPGYARTVGTRMVSGRDLGALDRTGAPWVAVVNEAMAARFWPDENALGQRFHFHGLDERVVEVVGVIADVKHRTLGEDPQPIVYVPRKQWYGPVMSLVVRAAGDPEALADALRREIRELDPNLAVTNVRTGVAAIEQGLWAARMGAWLLGVLGGLALVLAAVGIYGVMAYTVAQRDRELSVRMALGAGRREILSLVLRQGLLVVAVGLVAGVAAAGLLGKRIESLLYGVPGTDPATFAVTSLVLVAVALLATLVPALRATSIDPVKALRFER